MTAFDRERLQLGPLTIDPSKRRILHADGRELFLEPKVIHVLAALIEAAGEILSRDDLVELVWGGRAIGDEAVFRAISRLRVATEQIAAGVFTIETIPKAGYRLIADEAAPRPRLTPAAGEWWPDRRRERLAVLPFAAEPGTRTDLAEGFVAELLDEAGRIDGLEATGADSSFRLPAADRNPAGAARVLGATLVLEGQVAATADMMLITARLLRAPAGTLVWSQTLSGPLSEFFRLRDELLSRIVATSGAGDRPAVWRAVDPEALSLYLTAQARCRSTAPHPGVESELLFDRAVTRDPGLAEAWAALGASRLTSTYRAWLTAPRGTVFDRDRLTAAVSAAGRATALNPDMALPFITTANAMGYLGAWAESHRATQAAVVRGGAPVAMLLRLGLRREAVAVAREWARLNPLDGAAQFALAQSLRLVGDYFESVTAGEQAIALMPMTDSFYDLMMQLIGAQRFADARRLLDSDPDLLARAEIQYAPMTRDVFLYLIGDAPSPDPEAILARMDRGNGFNEMAAIIFARMGALRQGAVMLDRMGPYDVPVIHMIFGEDCAPLRGLESFGRLMQRIGLAAFWREGDHWPDFRFTQDDQVGRGAAPQEFGGRSSIIR